MLVGMFTDGGSVTYWKGSEGLACMTGRPTLGSTYVGEGSLLRQHEAHPANTRDSYHTTLATSRSGLSQIRCPPMVSTLAAQVDC